MLAILHANTDENSDDYRTTFQFLEELQDIQLQTHVVQGEQQKLTEIYLVGDTKKLNIEDIASLPAVEKVIRISHEFRILGKHAPESPSLDFLIQRSPLQPGQFPSVCRPVRCRPKGKRGRHDEMSAAVRATMHADGGLQTPHKPVFVSGTWVGLPALCF